jgi:hypothetical protein
MFRLQKPRIKPTKGLILAHFPNLLLLDHLLFLLPLLFTHLNLRRTLLGLRIHTEMVERIVFMS